MKSPPSARLHPLIRLSALPKASVDHFPSLPAPLFISPFRRSNDLTVREIIAGIAEASVVEDYPDYHKGACALVLQKDKRGSPIHVVWGLPKSGEAKAVLVTAYRPDPARWTDGFTRRVR
jgi:hypothetical protein